jgi:hypothetical protein
VHPALGRLVTELEADAVAHEIPEPADVVEQGVLDVRVDRQRAGQARVQDVAVADGQLAQSVPEDGAQARLVLVSRLERQVALRVDDETV